MRLRSRAARVVALLAACAATAGVPAIAYADPGTAATAAALPSARDGHTATTLADGRVLVVGGNPSGGSPSTAALYGPAADRWTPTAPSSDERRAGHAATLLADGRVLVTGGRIDYYGPAADVVYDPVADTWTPIGTGSGRRTGHAAIRLADGRVLVVGGSEYQPVAAVLYEPLTGTWSRTGVTHGRHGATTAVLLDDGSVLVASAYGGVAERWDPAAGTWTKVAPDTTRVVAVPGGALLLRHDGSAGVFSTLSGTVRPGGTMRAQRYAYGLVALPTGEVLAVGGETTATSTTSEVYDPATDLWRRGPAFGAARTQRVALAVTGGDVLLVGGTSDRTRVDRYTPPAVSPRPAARTEPAVVLEAHLGAPSGRAGAPLGVVAHLFRAGDEPVPGQTVLLFARAGTAGDWTPAGEAITDEHGAALFAVAPAADTVLAARHPGSATTAPAAAAELRYAVTPSPAAPLHPERALAEPGNGAVHVSWLAPTDDGGHPVTSYTVHARRTDVVDAGTTVTVGGDAREAAVTGLADGIRYEIAVRAHSAAGTGSAAYAAATPSATAPPRPAAPEGGTRVCGRLPLGRTAFTAAGSPYHVCPLGLLVGAGSTLEVTAAELRFTGPPRPVWTAGGLAVNGGGLRVVGSTLRGATGVPGEWGGIGLDRATALPHGVTRTSSTISLAGATVRHATDAVAVTRRASYVRFQDTLVAEASGAGVQVALSPVRVTGLTVRDVGGPGAELTCRPQYETVPPCAVAIDGLTVDRAGGRGLLVDTPGQVTARGVVVTSSGTTAPVSEAARFSRMTIAYGAGGDVEDVRGGGNGVDAVVLDVTHTRDLVWRTPAAGSPSTPLPLGFLAAGLRMAKGHSVTFPANSVVRALPGSDLPFAACPDSWGNAACTGTIDVTDGAIDASAPGTVFTSVGDAAAPGVPTCPSSFAPRCGDATYWRGLAAHGSRAAVTLTGATVRYASTALYLNGKESPGGPGLTAALTGTALLDSGNGVNAIGDDAGPAGSVTLTDVTVERVSSGAVRAYGFAALGLTRVAVRDAGSGVYLNGHDGSESCVRRVDVAVTGLVVERVERDPVHLIAVCRPRVRDVTVRRSGRPGVDDQIGQPAVTLQGAFALGAGAVEGLRGGGNGIDGVALKGYVTGGLTWVSPYNDPADHALGYLLGGYGSPGTLDVRGGVVTVPAGALVAALGPYFEWSGVPALRLSGASLDAAAGGARFVSVTDKLASELGCRRWCGTSSWGGITVLGATDTSAMGDVRIARATIRGGDVNLFSGADRADAVVSITGTTSDRVVSVQRPTRVVVTDSRLAAVAITRAAHADVSRNTLTGPAPAGVLLGGRGQTAPSDLVLRDNVAAAHVTGPGFVLMDAQLAIGPGTTVDRNLGSGDAAVLMLSGVTTKANLTWVSPTAIPAPHPVGYVVGRHGESRATEQLAVEGPYTLRLPANAVAKMSGSVVLRGAALDASAGGAIVTTLWDDTVGVSTCSDPYVYHYSGECNDPEVSERATASPVTIRSVPDPFSKRAGGVVLRRARVFGSVEVTGPANDAPGAPGYALAVDSSFVAGEVSARGAVASVTRSRVRTVGLSLADADGHVVRDVRLDRIYGTGLRLADATATVSRTEITETAAGYPYGGGSSAAELTGSSGGTWSCLNVRGNGNGIRAAGSALSIVDSTLTGNRPAAGAYDLDNTAPVRTTGVWWGLSGGPRAGQVRDPARHTDVGPAATPPACAGARPAAPPGPPRWVAATADAAEITAHWAAPSSDGFSEIQQYRVTVHPGGTTRTVGPDFQTVTIPVARGSAYAVTVTAVNAVGAGPPSRYSAPVHLTGNDPAAPVATVLTAAAPATVTYGGYALVTGRLTTAGGALPGRAVDLHVRRFGATTWGAPVARLTTSATGTVSRSVRLTAGSEVMLSYAGDAVSRPANSEHRSVAVRPVVTAAFSASTARLGTAVVLSGKVTPALGGQGARLERYSSVGWKPVASKPLSATSTYRFSVRPGLRGTWKYRVVFPGNTRYARAVSPTRALKVT